MKDVIGWEWDDILPHLIEDIAMGAFKMYCVACDEEVDEPVYSVEDEMQTYPLCLGCELVDLRLVILSQIADEREL